MADLCYGDVMSDVCCDVPCCDPSVTNTPGPAGSAGAAGADGVDGLNAFALVANYNPAAQPTMPAEGANRDVEYTTDISAFAVGQIVYQQNWGWMRVAAIVDNVTLTLTNLENTASSLYTENAAPGAALAAASRLSPGGLQGPIGTPAASPAPVSATYITQVPNATLTNEQALSALATGLVKNTTVTGVLSIAADGTDYLSPTTGLESTDLGVSVQAYNALLAAIAGLAPTVADRYIWTNGVNTVVAGIITATSRALLANASIQTWNAGLGGQIPAYGLLGSIQAVNLNSIADTILSVDSYVANTRYRIDKIMIENASISITTAQVGVFTAAGGLGTPIAAAQAIAGLTASGKWIALTLEAIVGTDVMIASPLYFRVSTVQGAPATAKVHLFGWSFDY